MGVNIHAFVVGKQVGRLTVTEQIDQKHQEDLQRLRGFRLLDDDFSQSVLREIRQSGS